MELALCWESDKSLWASATTAPNSWGLTPTWTDLSSCKCSSWVTLWTSPPWPWPLAGMAPTPWSTELDAWPRAIGTTLLPWESLMAIVLTLRFRGIPPDEDDLEVLRLGLATAAWTSMESVGKFRELGSDIGERYNNQNHQRPWIQNPSCFSIDKSSGAYAAKLDKIQKIQWKPVALCAAKQGPEMKSRWYGLNQFQWNTTQTKMDQWMKWISKLKSKSDWLESIGTSPNTWQKLSALFSLLRGLKTR